MQLMTRLTGSLSNASVVSYTSVRGVFIRTCEAGDATAACCAAATGPQVLLRSGSGMYILPRTSTSQRFSLVDSGVPLGTPAFTAMVM